MNRGDKWGGRGNCISVGSVKKIEKKIQSEKKKNCVADNWGGKGEDERKT